MLGSLRAIVMIVGVLLLAGAAVLLGQMMAGANPLDALAFAAPGAVGAILFVIGWRMPRRTLLRSGAGVLAADHAGGELGDLADLGGALAPSDAAQGGDDV